MKGPDMRYSNDPSYPKQPVRTALLTALLIGLLFVAAAPFVDKIERITFLFSALALSVFLGFFVVGFSLCPFQFAKWGLLVTISLIVLELFLVVLIVLFQPIDQAVFIAASVLPKLLLISVIVDTGFAFYGWTRFALQGYRPYEVSIEGGSDKIPESEAYLSINRVSQITFRITTFWVLVDGREIGGIKNGKTETFKITPGEHSIQLHAGCWYRSEKLVFSLQPHQTITFECGSHVNGWKVLLSPILLFWPGVWVYIRRAG